MTSLTPPGTRLPRRRSVTPPTAVNLIALLTRFMMIRRSFSSSPWTIVSSPENRVGSKRNAIPLAVAFAWKVCTAIWQTRSTSIGAVWRASPPLGVELGEVEDLVQRLQQAVGGLARDMDQRAAPLGRVWSSSSSASEPMMPFIGVRIS
jgi:hypothetical protein